MNNITSPSIKAFSKQLEMIEKISKIFLALVLFCAGALILALYEGLIEMNIYMVYIIVGFIIGIGVVQIIHAFSKRLY